MVPVEIFCYSLTMCPEWITFNELYLTIQRQCLGGKVRESWSHKHILARTIDSR